ncbi:MAG: hypothetical protein ACD_28C00128G0002 [uncultured bacterium]|nr:MAG: hypothetical protein ACD_28C00128G0002 [uncultured bacterium]
MIKGGKGGGNTLTGLNFEHGRDILALLRKARGYKVRENVIYFEGKEVARSYKKRYLYKYLQSRGVDYRKILSKRLEPDEALYVIVKNTLYILEMKFQHGPGSVDEKLQTCDFKKKHYQKLMSQLNIDVEYIYILSEWFQRSEYRDTLNYIHEVGCHYYFQYLPLKKIGLPVPVGSS